MRAEARRETIVTAAMRKFASRGYERTRVADIATALKVTEPVVFQQFGSKAGLFIAVVGRATDEFAAHLEGMAEENPDVLTLLAQMLSAEHLDRLHQKGGLGVLFADATRRPIGDPIRDAADRGITRIVRMVGQMLRRGQSAGSVRRDIAATELAWFALSLIQAWAFRHSHRVGPVPSFERDIIAGEIDSMRPRSRRARRGL